MTDTTDTTNSPFSAGQQKRESALRSARSILGNAAFGGDALPAERTVENLIELAEYIIAGDHPVAEASREETDRVFRTGDGSRHDPYTLHTSFTEAEVDEAGNIVNLGGKTVRITTDVRAKLGSVGPEVSPFTSKVPPTHTAR